MEKTKIYKLCTAGLSGNLCPEATVIHQLSMPVGTSVLTCRLNEKENYIELMVSEPEKESYTEQKHVTRFFITAWYYHHEILLLPNTNRIYIGFVVFKGATTQLFELEFIK